MSRSVLIAVFLSALVVRLWFNFVFPHINNAGAADGSEYLRLAAALNQYFSQADGDLSLLTGFKQSGPVFPLFILLSQKAATILGSFSDLSAPIFGQCLLAAVADVFLCLTANLLWGRLPALLCAVFSIFYPAFLINSGRLYTESFSTSLGVIILYIMCRGFVGEKRERLMFVVLGAALAALQLTRSVMILLSFASLPLIFIQERKSSFKSALVLLLLSMSAVMIPWLLAQQAIFHKSSLVVDRVGNYNLFVGTNPLISGWLSYPYPDGNGIEKRSGLSILKENVKRSPSRSFKLMLDKPYRLAKFPWNDFRTDAGPFTFPFQVAYHQLLLLLCAIGLCLSFVRNSEGESPPADIFKGRLLLFLYLAGHVIYCFFITVPRYNLTAMPVLILFAAAGAADLLLLFKKGLLKGVTILSAFLVLFFLARCSEIGLIYGLTASPVAALIVLCLLKGLFAGLFFLILWKQFPRPDARPKLAFAAHLTVASVAAILIACPARANGRAFEWQATLKESGDKVVQKIKLDEKDRAALKGEQLYLLIDLDGARDFARSGRLTVNTEPIDGPFIPSIALTQDFSAEKYTGKGQVYFECEWIYDCMAAAAGISAGDIRQWFVVPMPPKVVQSALASGLFSVEIENKNGARPFKIFGGYRPYCASPTYNSTSWEKAFYGVENDRGFTDSRYDTKIDLRRHADATFISRKNKDASDLSPSLGLQQGSFNVLLLGSKGPAGSLAAVHCAAFPARLSVAKGEQKLLSASIDGQLCEPSSKEIWLFRLKGKSLAPKGKVMVSPKMSILLKNKSGKTLTYPCRWLPRELPAENSAAVFDYCFPMMPSLLKEKIISAEISLQSTDNNARAGSSLEIEDLSLEILPISTNPLSTQSVSF